MYDSCKCATERKRAVLEPVGEWVDCGNMAKRTTAKHHHEESSESENETEPAKIFHRRLSTNVKSSVSIIDGGNICVLSIPLLNRLSI